MKSNLSNLRCV